LPRRIEMLLAGLVSASPASVFSATSMTPSSSSSWPTWALATAGSAWLVLAALHSKGALGRGAFSRLFGRLHFWPALVLLTLPHLGWIGPLASAILSPPRPQSFASSWRGGLRCWAHELAPGLWLGAVPLQLSQRSLWGRIWRSIISPLLPDWASLSPGRTGLGRLGLSLDQVSLLHAKGVRAAINLLDEYAGPREEYALRGWAQLRLPTIDHIEPSVGDLVRGAEFIGAVRGDLDAGVLARESGASGDFAVRAAMEALGEHDNRSSAKPRGVIVHCKAGHGRSAAVVFCYLYVFGDGYGELPGSNGGGEQLDETRLQLVQDTIISIRKVRKSLWKQRNVQEACAELLRRNEARVDLAGGAAEPR
jgi:hypothetical protein